MAAASPRNLAMNVFALGLGSQVVLNVWRIALRKKGARVSVVNQNFEARSFLPEKLWRGAHDRGAVYSTPNTPIRA